MPTDLSIASRRIEDAHATHHGDTAVILVSLIACLANLVLIALSPPFAAAIAALGPY